MSHHVAHYVIAAALAAGLVAGFLWLRQDVTTEVQTHTEIRSFGFAAEPSK